MENKIVSKTIGVFTPELSNGYEAEIWRGIERRARERGQGVISFLGSRIDSPVDTESAANIVYELATKGCIDGLVVVSAAVATYLDAERLASFFRTMQGIPAVSVGVRLPGASSVTVDGTEAIRGLVRHLVDAHGRRRFALISGPRDHAEVMSRRAAIGEAVAREGLRIDERLVGTGRWFRSSGFEVASRFIDSGLPFDAIICMNDMMAIGAIRALRGRGIRVPEEVSVAGFDGIEEGRTLIHPLTSIVQPLLELGEVAVDTLDELMAGGAVLHRVLGCPLSIRESCGCAPERRPAVEPGTSPADLTPAELHTVELLARYAACGEREEFVGELNRAAIASVLKGEEPGRWNVVLEHLRSESPATRTAFGGTVAQSLYEDALQLVGEIRVRDQAVRRAAVEERFAELRSISASLAGSFELDELFANLREGLLRLGVGEGFVALFEPGKSWSWARLVLAPDSVGEVHRRFRATELLPPEVAEDWRELRWVLEPLVFQDEPLGYMLLPGGYGESALYDTLGGQVSSALKGALLLQQVRSHERTLEAEVRRRTKELTCTNAELKEEIERRVRLESEVIDISNRTMERIGQDLHDDLCQHLAGVAMLASVAESSLEQGGRPEVQSIRNIGELLEGSIVRVKQIARGLTPTGLEAHGLPAAIEALVENARKSYPVTIDFRASPAFALPDTGRALQIYRIVQEALSNAVKHSGSDHIVVTLSCRNGTGTGRGDRRLIVEVRDSGTGIPNAPPHDGMGLRIMRYRAEKAGVELSIEPARPGTRVVCKVVQDPREGR